MHVLRRFLLPLIALAVLPLPVRACNVPVFRFALERWTPQPYEFIIFHKGALGTASAEIVESLRTYEEKPDCPTNFQVVLVDLQAKPPKELVELHEKHRPPSLPWLVVRYPRSAGVSTSVYAGPLDDAVIRKVWDSPVRKELARRLLKGDSVIWVLLECGDKDKDDKAHGVLKASLDKLEKTLKLPELTDSPRDRLSGKGPELKLAFSILRLARSNPQEQHLVQMLLNMEEELAQEKETMVFPVFGRGIALWALVGAGITGENIERGATFLTGACSCEVRAEAPGVDLLMTVPWEDGLEGRYVPEPEMPPLTGLSPAGQALADEATPAQPVSEPATAGEAMPLLRNVGLALVGGLLLLAAAAWMILGRKAT